VAGVAVAGFTDWLDGYIAKNYNQTVRSQGINWQAILVLPA
jgi:hypothetical protein